MAQIKIKNVECIESTDHMGYVTIWIRTSENDKNADQYVYVAPHIRLTIDEDPSIVKLEL